MIKRTVRNVGKTNEFFFQGKRYRTDRPGFERQTVLAHYDSESGNVHKIEGKAIVESGVHFIEDTGCGRSDDE